MIKRKNKPSLWTYLYFLMFTLITLNLVLQSWSVAIGSYIALSADKYIDDWLITCLLDRMIDWLIDWLFDYLIDWLFDYLIDWLIDWLID